MSRGLGTVQRKIILLLLGGVALGLSRSPQQHWRVLKMMRREWRAINDAAFSVAIRALYQARLVEEKINPDGSIRLVLSEAGEKKALSFQLHEMKIKKPKVWDRRWRLVIFDIPEKHKKVRDALRFHLKRLCFLELQKSVFVHPYPCSEEVEFLVEFFEMRSYVRQLIVHWIDNEQHLRLKFRLIRDRG